MLLKSTLLGGAFFLAAVSVAEAQQQWPYPPYPPVPHYPPSGRDWQWRGYPSAPLPGYPPSWSYDPYTAGGGCPNCGGKN